MTQVSRTIGVVGAGAMGNGIAHVFARAEFDVVLYEVSREALDRGLATIRTNLDREAAKGNVDPADVESIFKRITPTLEIDALKHCSLVVEAASEKLAVKQEIFRKLDGLLHPDAILASNTSSISITRLAASTKRPERFIGMHFMNPAPVMKLVELIRGIATAEATYRAARTLAERLGKDTAMSEDFPAFIVNRILVPMINEAVYALHEGVGSVAAIDNAMKLGANHPMGPLELADFIGLDTCLFIMQVLHEGLADSKYRPCPLLVKYVEAGWLGRKAKRGFYDYSVNPPRPTR